MLREVKDLEIDQFNYDMKITIGDLQNSLRAFKLFLVKFLIKISEWNYSIYNAALIEVFSSEIIPINFDIFRIFSPKLLIHSQ